MNTPNQTPNPQPIPTNDEPSTTDRRDRTRSASRAFRVRLSTTAASGASA